MATINLGNIKFNWQGAYAGGTSYNIDDVVSYNGSSYICKLASTGNLPTNNTYWDQMSSAGTNGTNGTDLTTTLTTQGDLVYRDGSGLQRLGAGTAGQVLQTGGAGANPSWSTLSSDYVKLAEVNATGTASSIDFTDVFTSDYHGYQLLGKDIYMNTGQQVINCRFSTSGGTVVTTNYTFYHAKTYNDFGSSNNIGSAGNSLTNVHDRIFLDGIMGTDSTNTSSLELIIQPSIVSGKNSFINAEAFTVLTTGANPYRHFIKAYGHPQDTSAMTGITLQGSAGNNINGNFILYGMKS